MKTIYGMIKSVDENRRIISINHHKKTHFFYMSKGMFNQFMEYFKPGLYAFLKVKDDSRMYKGLKVQNVISIDKLLIPSGKKPKVFFDISMIKTEIKKLVNQKKNRLFLDFEMSMPPYQNYHNFISEIIQVGFVLTDENGRIIEKYGAYIKPELFPNLSKRTLKFLEINQEDVDCGQPYEHLHYLLKKIQNVYQPMIYVWGKNDKSELVKLNKIHNLEPFINDLQFVDLLSLHKTYYRLKNDLGLFSAYQLYQNVPQTKQKHDALEDATITQVVFEGFKAVCNGHLKVNIK